ncbi:MurR/RpiR family transcriptional regulator [Rhodococcus koreensis]
MADEHRATPWTAASGATSTAIRAAVPSLTPSERRVAEVCLERSGDVVWGSVADLAAQSRTSSATVVRACRSLGYAGFRHLRGALLEELGASARECSPRPQVDPASGADVLRSTFADMSEGLRNTLGALDPVAVGRAVRLLAAADVVLVLGNGQSAPLAAASAALFLQAGRRSEAPADAFVQKLTAGRLLRPNVVLAVSCSGQNPSTLEAVEAARATGTASVVGLSCRAESALIESSDIGIVVPGGEPVSVLATLVSLQIASFSLTTESFGG